MITRIAGAIATRSRAVATDDLVFTVAVSPDKTPSLYEQTKGALAQLDRNLADAGSDKSLLLSATVYITNMSEKGEMNRAWDEWVDRENPPQRACVGVALEGRDLVEITVVALRKA
ncbi:RidA family protein [Terrarubrum flagellatum]|uniref:RidA family protein n=1 Tax=Terrirubrum flagellatum TaxID=2895980 RepID=UPI0031451AB0